MELGDAWPWIDMLASSLQLHGRIFRTGSDWLLACQSTPCSGRFLANSFSESLVATTGRKATICQCFHTICQSWVGSLGILGLSCRLRWEPTSSQLEKLASLGRCASSQLECRTRRQGGCQGDKEGRTARTFVLMRSFATWK